MGAKLRWKFLTCKTGFHPHSNERLIDDLLLCVCYQAITTKSIANKDNSMGWVQYFQVVKSAIITYRLKVQREEDILRYWFSCNFSKDMIALKLAKSSVSDIKIFSQTNKRVRMLRNFSDHSLVKRWRAGLELCSALFAANPRNQGVSILRFMCHQVMEKWLAKWHTRKVPE